MLYICFFFQYIKSIYKLTKFQVCTSTIKYSFCDPKKTLTKCLAYIKIPNISPPYSRPQSSLRIQAPPNISPPRNKLSAIMQVQPLKLSTTGKYINSHKTKKILAGFQRGFSFKRKMKVILAEGKLFFAYNIEVSLI